jgi:hypothetical protein
MRMRASAAAIAFVACLAAAGATWTLRRHVEDADLVAGAIALCAVAAAASTLLRRRLVAGLAVLVAAAGAWAASGGPNSIGAWLRPRAPLYVGGALAVALVALVFASERSEAAARAPKR